jgi:hypothetical protein
VLVPHLEGHEASHESHSVLQSFAEMGFIGKVEVIFIFIACFVQGGVFMRQVRLRIHAAAFCEQIRKLVASGNAARAAKLCAAAPGSPVAILIKMGLAASESQQNARAAMDAAYPKVLGAARGGLLFALAVGAVAFCVGGVILAEDGVTTIAIVPLGLIAMFGVSNALRFAAWPRELALACDTFTR